MTNRFEWDRPPDGPTGDRLIWWRWRRGLSRQTLAEQAGVTTHTLRRIERGQTLSPHPVTIRLLAARLGIQPEDLT